MTLFFPCDQWLYVQISANWSVLDDIVSKQWVRLSNELYQKRIVEKSFFVRYFERTPQLRLRFKLIESSDASSVMEIFYQIMTPYVKKECIWDISIRTYNRESLRYHKELIEATESLFCIDSVIVAKTILLSDKYNRENSRILASVILTDLYLSYFDYSLTQKEKLLKELSLIYKKKYGFNKYNSKQFNEKYRFFKHEIEKALSGNSDDAFVLDLTNVCVAYANEVSLVCDLLLKGMYQYKLDKNELLMSYIHMMFNRIFIARNQIYELLIYDFMTRCYSGILARI